MPTVEITLHKKPLQLVSRSGQIYDTELFTCYPVYLLSCHYPR